MRFSRTPRPAWVEGRVDQDAEHVRISYGQDRRVVALVAPHRSEGFTVQFLLKPRAADPHVSRMLDAVQKELTFYLLDVVGPNSWPFVQYHCDTLANRCSIVRWSWHPKPEPLETKPRVAAQAASRRATTRARLPAKKLAKRS